MPYEISIPYAISSLSQYEFMELRSFHFIEVKNDFFVLIYQYLRLVAKFASTLQVISWHHGAPLTCRVSPQALFIDPEKNTLRFLL